MPKMLILKKVLFINIEKQSDCQTHTQSNDAKSQNRAYLFSNIMQKYNFKRKCGTDI